MKASPTPTRGTRAWLAAAIVCLVAAIGVQYAREHRVSAPAQDEEVLYLRSGTAISRLALGFKALLADVYWIRAVQYFGGQKLQQRAELQHDLLYPLLDITTTLDPHFNIAYRFGSIFLAEGYPHPPGRPDLSVKLLEKGFESDPKKWQYLYDAAFIHYWYARDYEKAADWFTKASKVPGSPDWLPGLAAATRTRGGNRAGARFLWQQVYQNSEAGYMRDNARRSLVQLDIMDELDRLNAALARVSAESGGIVTSWDPLVARGWLRRNPPVDPGGTPYVIDQQTGRATISHDSQFYPLPDNLPAQAGTPGQSQ
jgi:tetratricopeptide (TPR) repeat protein